MIDDPDFVRRIAENPADDGPRLVYADFLEERGDEPDIARARFIRVQCERARLKATDPNFKDLWAEDGQLLDWAKVWRRVFPSLDGCTWGGFTRGFIERVSLPAVSYIKHAEQIHRLAPVTKVELTQFNQELARALGDLPSLRTISVLRILTYGDISTNNTSIYTTGGERLVMEVDTYSNKAETLWTMVRWPDLPRLRELVIEHWPSAQFYYRRRQRYSNDPADWEQAIEASDDLVRRFGPILKRNPVT